MGVLIRSCVFFKQSSAVYLSGQIKTDPISLFIKRWEKKNRRKKFNWTLRQFYIMGCFRPGILIALINVLWVGLTISDAAVSVVPQASSDGLCYKYVVQAGETCSMIAQAHSITVADIETYNARSWKWSGCEQIPQGAFICLSAGEPMMPVALPNAACGPQVPGTIRPNNWSQLGSLNPCAANECVSRVLGIILSVEN